MATEAVDVFMRHRCAGAYIDDDDAAAARGRPNALETVGDEPLPPPLLPLWRYSDDAEIE